MKLKYRSQDEEASELYSDYRLWATINTLCTIALVMLATPYAVVLALVLFLGSTMHLTDQFLVWTIAMGALLAGTLLSGWVSDRKEGKYLLATANPLRSWLEGGDDEAPKRG